MSNFNEVFNTYLFMNKFSFEISFVWEILLELFLIFPPNDFCKEKKNSFLFLTNNSLSYKDRSLNNLNK